MNEEQKISAKKAFSATIFSYHLRYIQKIDFFKINNNKIKYNTINIYIFFICNFFLSQMSPSPTNYETGSLTSEQIQQSSYHPNDKAQLYLKFEAPTDYTIRVIVLYSQSRSLNFDSARRTFLSFDIDQ